VGTGGYWFEESEKMKEIAAATRLHVQSQEVFKAAASVYSQHSETRMFFERRKLNIPNFRAGDI